MQKLDSEKFRAALEASVAEKFKRLQRATAAPGGARQTVEHRRTEFEALIDNGRRK